jgi:hypothetical protein
VRRTEVACLFALVLSGSFLAMSAEAAPRPQPAGTAPLRVHLEVVHRSFPAVSSPCGRPSSGPLSYGWPVKPFRRQHPIRGYFGDPRTIGFEQLGTDGPGSAGSFTFHNGVDIYARDGTAVYPVVSGLAHIKSGDEVSVTTGDGRAFQYFHIKPVVTPGQPVIAYRTVLGYVRRPWQHVHLTEIDDFRVHNPLDPGHLEPYRDHTVPTVEQLSFIAADDRVVDPRRLQGTVAIVADAADTPAMPVPGHWLGFPVAPAFVGWRLVSSRGVLVERQVAADFRFREPSDRDFWDVYAEGTYQNFPDFTKHFYWHVPGRYLFNLTPTPLDTRTLPNGRYRITVTAADTCGNRGTLTETIRIDNRRPTARTAAASS